MTVQYLSQEKYNELQKELDQLKLHDMPATATRIDEAKQMGDLSENAEYHAAREQLAWQQSRSKEIVYILDNSEVVTGASGVSTIGIGNTLEVEVNNKVRTYTLVGAQEADPVEGKISNESPLGEAFIGKKVGDSVDVDIPSGRQTYTIKSIS